MCKVVKFNVGDKLVRAAGIKEKYIRNIVEQADRCTFIDRVILFGSSLNAECTKDSDIDIAVFGNLSEGKMLASKEYKQFIGDIFQFDFSQNYDVLYFDENKKNDVSIMEDIIKGEVLYER